MRSKCRGDLSPRGLDGGVSWVIDVELDKYADAAHSPERAMSARDKRTAVDARSLDLGHDVR